MTGGPQRCLKRRWHSYRHLERRTRAGMPPLGSHTMGRLGWGGRSMALSSPASAICRRLLPRRQRHGPPSRSTGTAIHYNPCKMLCIWPCGS